jgi:hypothetical protein
MKRRELLMLVASGGSVFAPSLSSDEHALDEIVDPDAADTGETDSTVTRPDESPSDGTDSAADDAETVELTIELY